MDSVKPITTLFFFYIYITPNMVVTVEESSAQFFLAFTLSC